MYGLILTNRRRTKYCSPVLSQKRPLSRLGYKEERWIMMNLKWDCIIIGGGLSGLVAANYVSKHFKNVLVIEKSHELGGRGRTNVKDDCYFNLGPHALYKKGIGLKTLRELQVDINGGSPPIKGKLIKNEKLYTMPFSFVNLPFSKMLNWKEKFDFIKLFLRISKVRSLPFKEENLESWVNTNIRYETVRQIFYGITRLATYSNTPTLISAKHVLHQVHQSLGGTIYVDRGWQTIINQLKTSAVQSGVTIQNGVYVDKIQKRGPNFTVTLSDHTTFDTNYVITTASPNETMNLFDFNSNILSEIVNQIKPIKGASLDIALKKLPNPNIQFALSLDAPLYFSNHSFCASLSEKENAVVLHVFKYLSDGEESDSKKVKKELEDFLSYLQPNWQREVITSRFLPSLFVSYAMPTTKMEHLMKKLETDIPGLVIAGEWTNQDGMLADSAISSGKRAAELLINYGKE